MATYGDLKAKIADEIADSNGEFATQVVQKIDEAVRHYRHHRFWFTEGSLPVVTEAGESSYDMPTDWTGPQLVTVVLPDGSEDEVEPRAWNDWLLSGNPGSSGRPYEYALWQQKLWLYPTPDAAYTINLYSTRALAPFVDESTENAWTNEAEELIRKAAVRRMWQDVLRDYEEADRCELAEIKALRNLQRETAMRVANRVVRPWAF